MPTARQLATPRVHFHGNLGLNSDRAIGARYEYIEDPVTGEKGVTAIIIGNRPRNGKLVRGSKAIIAKQNAELPMRGGKILLATPRLEKVAREERWMLDTYDGKVVDIVVARDGLDWEQGDTGNHLQRLKREGTGAWPFGIVPYDADLIEMLKTEAADLFEAVVTAEPKLSLPKNGSDVHRIGALLKGKHWLSDIECSDWTMGAYSVGPRGIYYKLYVDGRVSQTRRNGQGELVEVFMGESMRKFVETLLRKQQGREHQATIEAALARKAAKAAAKAGDLDEGVREWVEDESAPRE